MGHTEAHGCSSGKIMGFGYSKEEGTGLWLLYRDSHLLLVTLREHTLLCGYSRGADSRGPDAGS